MKKINMIQDFHNEFDLAKKVIKKAGEISLSFYKKNVQRIDGGKSYSNIITEADITVEAYIRKELLLTFPKYGFIGEESEEDNKEISWIVDPIDGTTNYFRGISEFSNVIGLKSGKNMIFSLINIPLADNTYSAYIKEGAYKNMEKIHVSNISNMNDSIISLGARSFREEKYQEFSLKLSTSHNIRVSGSSSIDSVYLASGRIDTIIKFDQKIWDTAPEVLLMQEAGAIVTDFIGNPIKLEFSKTSRTSYITTNKLLAENEKKLLYSLY